MTEQTKKLLARIERNVTVNEETGCWEWNRYCNKTNGYGLVWVGRDEHGKYIWNNAHRLSYELFWGPVPEGMEVAHTCHTPKCCNPNHLVACTHKENIRMSVDAGRWVRGTDKKNAKLTERDVRIIKEGSIFEQLSQRAVARMFNINLTTLRSILTGDTWSHVTV